jgi:hypothetical protein
MKEKRILRAITFMLGTAGVGGTIGSAWASFMYGSTNGPTGAMIGVGVGAFIGLLGGWFNWGFTKPALLNRNDASRHLFDEYAANDPVLTMDRILYALNNEIQSYVLDPPNGPPYYDQRDLDRWAKNKPWRAS